MMTTNKRCADALTDLLPCPYCGHAAQMTMGDGPFVGRVQVECASCRIATFWYEEAVAVRQWNRRVATSPVSRTETASIDEFNGDTNTLIRSIMTLLEMDAAGALGEHGVGDHARDLLGAAAARLAAVPPYEPGPKQPSRLVAQSAAPADARAATCEAIDVAIAFGYQNTNVPSSDDHWLTKYWHMGQKLAQLDALPASARYPIAWVRFRSDGGFEGPIMDSDERMCDTRRKSGAWSPLFLGPAQATEAVAYRLLRWNIVSKEWVTDSRDWVDGAPSADLLAETAERSSEWRVQVAFAGPLPAAQASFQQRVRPWILACFGAEISADVPERNHRFFEEAGELVQSRGMTREEAHALVDYTWSRPVGEPAQEVGGVMVTLAALCLANGLDMHAAGERELARVNEPSTIERIRAKQATKPTHSPLPGVVATGDSHGSDA
ncbi:TPA: Lar family restriction alleviation protein [Burkholderia cenocepacia]|nr:Lar family restriction alleviation protein [Burkholderia cenocepacia]